MIREFQMLSAFYTFIQITTNLNQYVENMIDEAKYTIHNPNTKNIEKTNHRS